MMKCKSFSRALMIFGSARCLHQVHQDGTNKSIKAVGLIGARSLINQAAGSPVASVMNPMMRNVQAGPKRDMRPSMAKLIAVPPRPPLAYTMPLASPRFLLKYCAGVTDTTCRG